MNIWIETTIIGIVALIGLFIASIIYCSILIFIGRKTSGALKVISAGIVYCLFAVFLVSPLIFMIQETKQYSENQEQLSTLLFQMGIFALSVAPALWYVFKFKIHELRTYGYYVKKK